MGRRRRRYKADRRHRPPGRHRARARPGGEESGAAFRQRSRQLCPACQGAGATGPRSPGLQQPGPGVRDVQQGGVPPAGRQLFLREDGDPAGGRHNYRSRPLPHRQPGRRAGQAARCDVPDGFAQAVQVLVLRRRDADGHSRLAQRGDRLRLYGRRTAAGRGEDLHPQTDLQCALRRQPCRRQPAAPDTRRVPPGRRRRR